MPKYQIKALEKFLVETTYVVEAESKKDAEALCMSGKVAYDDKEIVGEDDEWIETLEVEQV